MECRKVQPLHICNFLNMRYFITCIRLYRYSLFMLKFYLGGGGHGGWGGGQFRTPQDRKKINK